MDWFDALCLFVIMVLLLAVLFMGSGGDLYRVTH